MDQIEKQPLVDVMIISLSQRPREREGEREISGMEAIGRKREEREEKKRCENGVYQVDRFEMNVN